MIGDDYHHDDCEVFEGTIRSKHRSVPCSCGFETRLAEERREVVERIRAEWEDVKAETVPQFFPGDDLLRLLIGHMNAILDAALTA